MSSVVMPSVVMPSVVMPSVVMPSVVMPSVVMPSVVAPFLTTITQFGSLKIWKWCSKLLLLSLKGMKHIRALFWNFFCGMQMDGRGRIRYLLIKVGHYYAFYPPWLIDDITKVLRIIFWSFSTWIRTSDLSISSRIFYHWLSPAGLKGLFSVEQNSLNILYVIISYYF